MGRICLEKSTGKIIEYQSTHAPLGTLVQNAVNGGYSASDVEEKYIETSDYKKLINEQEALRNPE